MTMQIKGVQIAGLPAITVRNMLRRAHSALDEDFVSERCKLSNRLAKRIIQELVNDGYIEFSERSRVLAYPYTPGKEKPRYRSVDYYKLTEKGRKLTQASAVSKLRSTRADRRRVAEASGRSKRKCGIHVSGFDGHCVWKLYLSTPSILPHK
jgi:predicted transcriptional regulator